MPTEKGADVKSERISDSELVSYLARVDKNPSQIIADLHLIKAKVTARDLNTSTVTLEVGGDSSQTVPGVGVIGRVPYVNEQVWCFEQGNMLICLGPITGDGVRTRPPRARVVRNSDQSINNATDTALSFNVETFDYGDMYAGGSPTRLTFPVGGWYSVGAQVRWATSASTGERYACVRRNGTTLDRVAEQGVSPSGGIVTLNLASVSPFNAGDYIETIVFQSTGVALNAIATFTYSLSMWAALVETH